MHDSLQAQLTQLLLDKGCTINQEAMEALAKFVGNYSTSNLSMIKDRISHLQDAIDAEAGITQ